MQDDFGTAPIEPTDSSRIQKQDQAQAKKISINQEASQIAMTQYANEAAFNPVMMSKRFQTLEEKMRKKATEKQAAEKAESKISSIEKIEELSLKFERKNPELHDLIPKSASAHRPVFEISTAISQATLEKRQLFLAS